MAGPRLRLSLRKVKVDVDNLTDPPSGLVYQAVSRAGQAAVDAVKDETPVRSGALRDAWAYRVRTTPSGVVLAEIYVKGPQGRVSAGEKAAPSQYIRFVTFGTSGPIKSTRPGGVMKISSGGAVIFRDQVAGQSANDFAAKAVKRIRKQDFEA